MLEAFFEVELKGSANEDARRHAKAATQLAVALQHKRTADFTMAALCAEATSSVVNLLAVLSGRRGRSLCTGLGTGFESGASTGNRLYILDKMSNCGVSVLDVVLSMRKPQIDLDRTSISECEMKCDLRAHPRSFDS
jgi:hypothetical protein